MLFEALVPEMKKLVICVFAVKHTAVTQCQTMRVTAPHLTTQCLFLFYFLWPYYNKYFINYLQIKSSLVLIINYSII